MVLQVARDGAGAQWAKGHVLHFDAAVVERARGRFPLEPIRTLDAPHVAFYERTRKLFPGAAMLSLDERIRPVVRALGGAVLPA